MILPENVRAESTSVKKRKIMIYGQPMCGKSYLANSFPDVLFLSTDGNYKYLPGGVPPHVDIVNKVSMNGRIATTTLAWDIFKDTITELEKKQNSFKTIIVDLLEDTHEYARLYIYKQMGIEHESEDSFRAWDRVKTEYLSTIKRLMALDYENILVLAHEDTTKDIMKRNGDKITAIKPNLNEKIANKIAGMVDIVARITVEDGKRYINFKTDEVVFGGGRLNTTVDRIPCTYEALMKVYDEVGNSELNAEPQPIRRTRTTRGASDVTTEAKAVEETVSEPIEQLTEQETVAESEAPVVEEKPTRKTRKVRG